MSENRACAVNNFRWKHPNGRVSWTYRTRLAAESVKAHQPEGSVLESSPDNGETWTAAAEVRSTANETRETK